MDEQATVRHTSQVARWLKDDPAISWLHCQLSGARDGACALDNITQASVGHPVRRSCYGNAPGGAVRLDPRMLRAMRDLAKRGFTFRVTSLAGASHGHKSLHYSGLAFDVDTINGQRVSWGNPHWRSFVRRCRELGATETFGPGDPGHSSHVHVAWPR